MSVSLQSQAANTYGSATPQQSTYFSGVHFAGRTKKAKETGDTVEITQQDADQTGNQRAATGKKSSLVKAGVKLATAAALALASVTVLLPFHIFVMPAAVAAGLWGLLDLYKATKGAKGKDNADTGDAETTQPPAADAPTEDAGADDNAAAAQTVSPLDETDADVIEVPLQEAAAEIGAAAAGETLAETGQTIKVSDVKNLVQGNVTTTEVINVINTVMAERYGNVAKLNPRATAQQIDTALADAVVAYFAEQQQAAE